MTYLYRRGKGVKRRVAHLATYDKRGNIAGTWCGRHPRVNTSCNLPLGLRVCKLCRKAEARSA